MAQKSGFFSAIFNAGIPDRKYSAEDYSDNLGAIISSGVFRSTNDDLKVTASGLNLTVGVGRGWIEGHYYNNTTPYALPIITPPTGGSRIDRVVLRCDTSAPVRSVSLAYLTGEAAVDPVAPALTRSGDVYELCLAEITVAANAQSVSVKDTRPDKTICGWVYSTAGDDSFFTSLDDAFNEWFDEKKDTLASVTLFKQYKQDITLAEAAATIAFDIPQYDPNVCILQVYVNGILSNDYVPGPTSVSFASPLLAGTEITFVVYKSIDGTGIGDVLDEITELQNEYAAISGASKFVYKATGVSDNVSLSQIVAAIYAKEYDPETVTEAADAFLTALGGNTYLAALPELAQIKIEVVGSLGVTAPYAGSGTAGSRYRYFDLGASDHSLMRLIFDFSKAQRINITCDDDTQNIIFFGADLDIRNVRCRAANTGSGCGIAMTASATAGDVYLENCDLRVITTGAAVIASQGTVMNCSTYAKSTAANALSFNPGSNNMIRVIGGRHYAYTGASGAISTVVYVSSSATNAVAILTDVSCPTVTEGGGAVQNYLAASYAGTTLITAPVSTLPVVGDFVEVNNRINVSKPY